MSVNDNESFNQYTASASQTDFDYDFEINDADHIVVEQNGVTLTRTTHYTVSGVDSDTGGTVTLVTGATAGDIITLYAAYPAARATRWASQDDFNVAELETELDALYLLIQMLRSKALRALHLEEGDTTDHSAYPPVLPAKPSETVYVGRNNTGALVQLAAPADTTPVSTIAAAFLSQSTVRDTLEALGIYVGYVDSAGAAEDLPTGWTLSGPSSGVFTITHNLGLSDTKKLIVSVSHDDPGFGPSHEITYTANTLVLTAYEVITGTPQNVGFRFVAVNLEHGG